MSKQLQQGAMSPKQFRQWIGGMSEDLFYKEVANGELRTFKVGRRRFVSTGAGLEYIKRKEALASVNGIGK